MICAGIMGGFNGPDSYAIFDLYKILNKTLRLVFYNYDIIAYKP